MSFDERAFREQQERLMAENVALRTEVSRLQGTDTQKFNPDCPTRRRERAKALRCGARCRLKKGHAPLEEHQRLTGMSPLRCRPTRRCQENCSTGHCPHSGWQQSCSRCARRTKKRRA